MLSVANGRIYAATFCDEEYTSVTDKCEKRKAGTVMDRIAKLDFDHFDFLWCPRHKGTDRHFECTKLISAEQVITPIKKIPTFKGKENKGK